MFQTTNQMMYPSKKTMGRSTTLGRSTRVANHKRPHRSCQCHHPQEHTGTIPKAGVLILVPLQVFHLTKSLRFCQSDGSSKLILE